MNFQKWVNCFRAAVTGPSSRLSRRTRPRASQSTRVALWPRASAWRQNPYPQIASPNLGPQDRGCAWIYFLKCLCTSRASPFHLGLQYNCIDLINSFSFRSKVEVGAQGCKSNANPLWAPILWTIKTKSGSGGGGTAQNPRETSRTCRVPAGRAGRNLG